MGVPDEVRHWYEAHDMPVLTQDWYTRSESGESAGWQTERSRMTPLLPLEADNLWWWERKPWPWRARRTAERAHMEALETFFQPYIARLSPRNRTIVETLFNDRATFETLGQRLGITRQTAWEAAQRAVRELTKLAAEDCPHSQSKIQVHDEALWEEESVAVRALCALDRYWEASFGVPFPGVVREEPEGD